MQSLKAALLTFKTYSHRKCRPAATGRGNAKCETIRVFLQQSAEQCDSLVRLSNEELDSEAPALWFHFIVTIHSVAHISLKIKHDSLDN